MSCMVGVTLTPSDVPFPHFLVSTHLVKDDQRQLAEEREPQHRPRSHPLGSLHHAKVPEGEHDGEDVDQDHFPLRDCTCFDVFLANVSETLSTYVLKTWLSFPPFSTTIRWLQCDAEHECSLLHTEKKS